MRAIAVLLLVIVSGFAGCAVPAQTSQLPPAAAPASPALDFLLPGDAQNAGGEPNIAVAPDGSQVYVVAAGPSNEQHPYGTTPLWRFDAARENWSFLGDVPSSVGDNDADVAVRPDGSVWVADMWVADPVAHRARGDKCTAVSVSRDLGKSWSENPLGCGASPLNDERPWIAANADKTYLLRFQAAAGQFLASTPPSLSFTTDNTRWDDHPALTLPNGWSSRLVAKNGTLAFTYFVYDAASPALASGFQGPFLVTSANDGLSWTMLPIGKETMDMRHPGIGWDSPDHAVLSWVRLGPDGKGGLVRAVTKTGGSWSQPVSLDENGTNAMAWADGGFGHIAVAWLHTDALAHPCEVPADAPWRVRVWEDGVTRTLPTIVHKGPLADVIFSANCPAQARGLGDYVSAAVLPDGRVLVATPIDADAPVEPFSAPVHVLVAAQAS